MRVLKISFKLICSLALFFTMAHVQAATYYSRVASFTFAAAGNNWSTSRTGGTLVAYPGTGHSYIIQNTHSVTIGANQTAVAITVESGATLLSSGNFIITSPLTINSGGNFTISTRRMTMAGSLTNNGTITITTGRLIRNTYTLTNSGSITMGAGQFTASTGSFTNTATGTMTVTGTATITLGTGDFVNDNTSASVNFGSSAITISGTANQSIGGFTTTGRFTASKTAGTTTLTGGINANGITKSGAGTLDMGSYTHTSTGTIILTAGTMDGGSSTINANITSTSAWSGTATVFVPGTSTVNFGGVAQTLSATGTKTFYNLTLSNAGLKTLGTTTVNNIFSMEGTATASAAPTYGASATLQYNTATSRTVGAEWVSPFAGSGGVIIANTGTITTNGNKVFDLDVPLTINAAATLTTGTNTFSFGGDFINNGTWTSSTGDVTIALNSASQSIGALSTTGIVYVTKTAGEATFIGNINGGGLTLNATGGTLSLGSGLVHVFTGDLAGSGGTLNGNTSTIRIGAAVPAAISFNPNTSTVDYNGSVPQTIPAVSYYNLQTSTANTKTLGGDTTVGGVFTNNTGATFSPGSFVMTLSAAGSPFVNNGTFTAGTSTISFTNAGSVNIPALDYYNLDGTGGPRVFAGSGVIGIANTFTPGAGSYTVTGSTVSFNGSGAQSIPTFTFNDVILTNAGPKTINTAVSVKNITIETGPILNLNSSGGGLLTIY